MTAFADAEAAIRTRLNSNWITTPILWENTDLDPGNSAFVFCEILPADAQQASVGSPSARLYRHVGVIRLHVFVPANTGSGLALEYADTLAAIFRGVEFDDVLCLAPRLMRQGPADDDGKWWGVILSIPYQYDQVF